MQVGWNNTHKINTKKVDSSEEVQRFFRVHVGVASEPAQVRPRSNSGEMRIE